MPLTLSPSAYIEKNSLASNGVWIVLLEIFVPQLNDYIRVCTNNEDYEWNGQLWQSYPFEMDEIGDTTKGEVSQFAIKICNINGVVETYVDNANGATGSTVKMMVVNSNIPSTTPEVEFEFSVKSTNIDSNWVSFVLGVVNPYSILIGQRMIRTGCRYNGLNGTQNGFKGPRCKYVGPATDCNKTLTRCRELLNNHNFGGFPGIGIGNTFYV